MQGKGLGLILIAGVFFAAWLDNNLATLLGAILLAFLVTCSCKIFDRSPNAIYAHKMKTMRKRVQKIDDKHKDLRKQQEAGLKKDLEAIAQQETEDRQARLDVSMFAGLGAFLCPWLGVAWLIGVGARMLNAARREWQAKSVSHQSEEA